MACISCVVFMIIFGSSSAAGSQGSSVVYPPCTCSIHSAAMIDITEGFHLYKENSCLMPAYKNLENNSNVYSFAHNEFECRTIWCVYSVLNNSASGTVLRWRLPDSNSLSVGLCLCTYITGNGASNGSYSNKEGVHKCIQDGGNNGSVSSTLQFRHSISSLNSNKMCSTQMTIIQTSCTATSTVTMQKESSLVSSSLISNNYSTASYMSSPDFLNYTLTLSSSYTLSWSTSSAFSTSVSTTVSSVQSPSTVPHYTGIGLLVATNLLTIIALISSCVYIFCQRKKSKFIVTENEQISLQNTSQTEATSHNTETNPTSNNNTDITSGTNIYSSVEDEVDHHHHRPPARVASQYEVPLDLLQQAHVPLPPPPPLYATLDDQHDLTLPNPEYITNTAVTAPNPGYITNIAPKANPGYSATAIKEEGEGGERKRREELDYSYATVNKFLKKPTEDTEYNKLQHE